MGVSVAFDNGALHKLAQGAIVQNVTALHVQISAQGKAPSVSTQVASLRQALLSGDVAYFEKASKVSLHLVLPPCHTGPEISL